MGSAAALSLDDIIYAQYREAGVLLYRGFKMEQVGLFVYERAAKKEEKKKKRKETISHKYTHTNTHTQMEQISRELRSPFLLCSTCFSDQYRRLQQPLPFSVLHVFFYHCFIGTGSAHVSAFLFSL